MYIRQIRLPRQARTGMNVRSQPGRLGALCRSESAANRAQMALVGQPIRLRTSPIYCIGRSRQIQHDALRGESLPNCRIVSSNSHKWHKVLTYRVLPRNASTASNRRTWRPRSRNRRVFPTFWRSDTDRRDGSERGRFFENIFPTSDGENWAIRRIWSPRLCPGFCGEGLPRDKMGCGAQYPKVSGYRSLDFADMHLE
jgi:hypothetical protein